jgi:NADH dehydrogenase/NADH:ubiquinone oxidoreductase subunit G
MMSAEDKAKLDSGMDSYITLTDANGSNIQAPITETHIHTIIQIFRNNLKWLFNNILPKSTKGVANGVASLDANSKVPVDSTPTAASGNPVSSGGVKAALTAEAQARTSADSAQAQALADETAARTSADSAQAQALADETAARTSADSAAQALATETAAREAADSAHAELTSAHGSTAIPAINRISMFDGEKGLKSDKPPTENNDVIRKKELDNLKTVFLGVVRLQRIITERAPLIDPMILSTEREGTQLRTERAII